MGKLHLVTGYAGASHVTAADAASLNAAIVGPDNYVLNRGNQFAATIVTNNKITVLDGDLMMQGRHIRLVEGSTIDLSIDSGAAGYYRNDLIVARYTKNSSTGVEDCNLVVIKGTAVTGSPSDPAYTSGNILTGNVLQADMPLYRVPLSGLNVQTLVPLFKTINANLQNTGDGYQKTTEDLATVSVLASGDYIPVYDVSAAANKKTMFSAIISAIRKALFGTLTGVLKVDGSGNVSEQTVYTSVVADSDNLVTSGAVKKALDKKQDTTVRLWENSNPDSFSAKTITVAGAADYNHFGIVWKVNTYNRQLTTWHNIDSMEDVLIGAFDVDPESNSGTIFRKRNVTVNRTNETFTFDVGEYAQRSSYNEYDNVMVPLRIFANNIG